MITGLSHRKNTKSSQGVSRLEIMVLVVMVACLISIMVPFYSDKKRDKEIATAAFNVQSLYNRQVLQYFSNREFSYSLTRLTDWPDFFTAKPPYGRPEHLIGLEAKELQQDSPPYYVDWQAIGFPLKNISYYVYRVEPEPAFQPIAKDQEKDRNPYHFHAIAIGDTDGDRRYSALIRGGYVDKGNVFRGMPAIATVDLAE